MKQAIERTLLDLGFRRSTPRYRRLMERLGLLDRVDMRLALSVIHKIEQRLKSER
jgi:hypothetical protein